MTRQAGADHLTWRREGGKEVELDQAYYAKTANPICGHLIILRTKNVRKKSRTVQKQSHTVVLHIFCALTTPIDLL